MKKILLTILFAVIVFGAGVYVGAVQFSFFSCIIYSGVAQTKECITQISFIDASQKITSGKSGGDFFQYSLSEGSTALDLLETTANFETKGAGENAYVTSINGKDADNSKKEFWSFYVNGKMAEVGAGSYKLKDGDKIEWKLETY